MRYHDLFDAKAWRKYKGGYRQTRVLALDGRGTPEGNEIDVPACCGICLTGKQRVFVGYFVQVVLPNDEAVLAEDPHSMRAALREVGQSLRDRGWRLDAIGIDPQWYETGLSGNSGYGYHPKFEKAVHLLDPALIP